MCGSAKPIQIGAAGATRLAWTMVVGMVGALALALAAAGCGASPVDGPVPTGLLLAIQLAPGEAAPDELRISVYVEHGVLYMSQRLPATGALVPENAASGRLGTVAVHLPDGTLRTRFDLRGLSGGTERLRALGETDVLANRQEAITVTLAAPPPPDADGDGVPDSIDDCPSVADPNQTDSDGNGVGDVCEAAVDAGSNSDADVDATTDPARDAASAPEVAIDSAATDSAATDSARSDREDDRANDAAWDASAERSAEAAAFDALPPDGRLVPDGSTRDPLTDGSSAAGILAIVRIPSVPTVDLSAEGTLDWAHWGRMNVQGFDHKAGGGEKIRNLTVGAGHQSSNLAVTYVWTDGTPMKSGSTATGVYNMGAGAALSLKVAAGATATTLRLYLAANTVDARLTAHLSDGSAPDAVLDASGIPGAYEVPVEITFRSRTAGQTLTITWAETSLAVVNAIAIRAATLF